jgi:two-component system, NarL family, invasion response regulator UvrY
MLVLIVDDHPIVVSGCRAMLAQRPDIEVVEARNGEAGCTRYFELKPDVAVVDINLPGISGFEVMRRILAGDGDAKIIMFSMNDDAMFATRSIEQGARGYITKNDDPVDFVDAIVKVSGGNFCLSSEMAQQVAFSGKMGSPLDKLTPREAEILRLLCGGKTMTEIAAIVEISYKTVANTCSQIRQKLSARSQLDLLRIAMEYKP